MSEGTNSDKEKNRLFWMAGLELEIPVKQNWNIETGARFNSKWSEEENNCRNAGMFEIPLRLAYNKQLGNNFSLHVGAGPYASSNIDTHLEIGIEPAITFYWHHLNVGLSYDIPIHRNDHAKELASNPFMVTLGIRFKSKVWKHIGTGLYAVGVVAQGYTQAMQNNEAGNSTNIGTASSIGNSDSNSNIVNSSTKDSKTQPKKVNSQQLMSYSRSYGNYESQLAKMKSSGNYQVSEVRDIQRKMKEVREKYNKASDRTMSISPYETWNP